MRTLVGLMVGILLWPAVIGAVEPRAALVPNPYPGSYYNPPTESSLSAVATFDGEGEAEVAVELSVMNNGSEPLENLAITIAGTTVRVIRAIEEAKELVEDCTYRIQATEACPTHDAAVYRALELGTEQGNDELAVAFPLPQSIPVAEGRRIYLVYKATGYVNERLGQFAFDLPTPKVALDLASVRVNVRVTDGLYLKGGESQTDYQADSVAEGILTAQLDSSSTPTIAPRFQELGYAPVGLVKTTQSLDPDEQFHVTGSYSKRWLSLYWPALVLGLVALGALGAVLWYGERSLGRTPGNTPGVNSGNDTPGVKEGGRRGRLS